jgi:outer membrane receptor for ferrienterochelin and colicin
MSRVIESDGPDRYQVHTTNPGKKPATVDLADTMLLAASVIAQEQTKDLGEASLEELANITVYTASHHTQKITDAPSSVTVITGDEIQKYGYRTLADILRSVRGFDITYDRAYCFPSGLGIYTRRRGCG